VEVGTFWGRARRWLLAGVLFSASCIGEEMRAGRAMAWPFDIAFGTGTEGTVKTRAEGRMAWELDYTLFHASFLDGGFGLPE
jgi:hypothetical protein